MSSGTEPNFNLRLSEWIDLKAVLDQVKDGWEFVIDPDVRELSSKYSFL
jgi:hypothetical protein